MSETITNPPDQAVLDQEFLKTLVSLIRAEDTYGAWEGKSDDILLRPFILTTPHNAAWERTKVGAMR